MTNKDMFEPRWSRRAAEVGTLPFTGGARLPLSLAYGLPDPELFPRAGFAAASARILSDPAASAAALQYGSIAGHPPLIEMLVERLAQTEGLHVSPANLLITHGSSGAIGLAARLLVDDGDVVLVEAPSFVGALSILRRSGAQLYTVPVVASGLDVAGTESVLQTLHRQGVQPKALYTMPTFHNPTGLTLSLDSRVALLEVARRYNLVIIEDDAYRDLYYDSAEGSLPDSLYALDEDGRVIRTGTFSKTLAPGLRLGWALARPEVIERMMLLKEEGGTVNIAQHLVAEFGRDGALDAQVQTLVEAYRPKRDAMLNALESYLPDEAAWTRPAGGFFVWVTLPPSIDPPELARCALEQGVDYMPGAICFPEPLQPGNPTYLRLAFSLLSPEEIVEAVKRLGKAMRQTLGSAK